MSTKKAAVVMQTDFTKDISVCTMQGVCMMVDPELRVFDNTHEIKNFDTYQASTALSYVVDFWPAGTVFVSVVDPGVGTDRRACVAKLKNVTFFTEEICLHIAQQNLRLESSRMRKWGKPIL